MSLPDPTPRAHGADTIDLSDPHRLHLDRADIDGHTRSEGERSATRRELIDFWLATSPNRKARRRRDAQLRKARGRAPDAYLRVEDEVARAYFSWRRAMDAARRHETAPRGQE